MSVLSLPEAKTHLNITGSQDDAELAQTIDEAQAAIEGRIGPLESVTKTYRVYTHGESSIALPSAPVVSVTSITPIGGTPLSLTDVYVNTVAGTITYGFGMRFWSWGYDIVYQAGRATVPDDLLRAVKEMTKHLWETQRGGTVRPTRGGGESSSNTLPGAAYAFPYRVEQLIQPYMQSGFA